VHFLFRLFNAIMAGLFVWAAALQYNDPEPVRWIAIYLTTAIATILYIVGRLRWQVSAIIALIALIWAGMLVPRVWGRVTFSQLFESWQMANPAVVEGREMYGLLIAGCWMALVTVAILMEDSSLRWIERDGK
jgi:hypothetical protein